MIHLSPWEAALVLTTAWLVSVFALEALPAIICILGGLRARRRAQKDWDQGR